MAKHEKIVRTDASGDVFLRSGMLLTYFIDMPVHAAHGLAALFDHYVATIPKGALQWGITSATSEQWKRLDSKTIERCKESMTGDQAKKGKLTAFDLRDSAGAPPVYGFRLAGKPSGRDFPDGVTLAQMAFPIDQGTDERQVERLVDEVRKLSNMIEFFYGYCSPALLYGESQLLPALMELPGLALRHPGYDVQCNHITRLKLGCRVRGARWITLLGTKLTALAGGTALLRKKLDPKITLEKIGGGVMIRAGKVPELGDVNRRDRAPLLRSLAGALEPLTYFGESDLPFKEVDDTLLPRWQRRLLD